MHFLLINDLAPEFISRRVALRNEQLALAWRSVDAGELLLGGAVGEPTDQAFLLFSGSSAEAARRFAENDPYVRQGLVRNWLVKQWNTLVGQQAASPNRPG
jgi:uncharacterized protein YciI